MQPNSTDGQFVVVENGKRVTVPTPNEAEAQAEAERRNRLTESGNKSAVPENQKAQVKRNLMG